MTFGGTDLEDALDRRAAEGALELITAGPWWRSCGPPVTVSAPRGGTRASRARDHAGKVAIQLSDEQLNLATVAHELAHALADVGHGHDAVFRAAYVDVVAVLAGPAGAGALAEAFVAMGVEPGDRGWPAPYRAVGDGFVITSGCSRLGAVGGFTVDADGNPDPAVALDAAGIEEHCPSITLGDRRGAHQ